MDQKEILKQLLLVELEDMKTFDDDPMGFILRKYTSLNDIMIELMTRSYKEYLYGVYIVAPKPTTFKVVLHNKQYFYLVYLGPTYEASVAGKNYYLSDLGEKERCIVAISKMLRGGPPINTKGPEGAEKGSKDQEGGGGGGNFGGGGGDQSGGGEEGEPELTASAAADAEGGGEPEELTENAKLILKLLLEQDLNKDKDAKGSEEGEPEATQPKAQIKKKTRLPQTPILQKGSMTPKKLGLGEQAYRSSEQIIKIVSGSINKNIVGEDKEQVESTKRFLISLCEDVKNSEKSIDKEKLEGFETINFSKNTIDALSGVNRKDLNVIGIEFGEVLGAIYLAAGLVKINEKGISFPSDSNNPIYDFSVSDINVSSKYKKGAASSLRKVVEENNANNKNLTEGAKELLGTLSEAIERSASISYLYLAKNINDPEIDEAFSALREELGIDINLSMSDDDIKSLINNAILEIREQENGGMIVSEKLNSFYETIGRRQIPKGQEAKWHLLPGGSKENAQPSDITYYGLITSPMSYFLTDLINRKKESTENNTPYALLKELVQNTSITQLRLNFLLKEKSATFSSQSSKSANARFQFFPKVTANDPEKGVMSFRME